MAEPRKNVRFTLAYDGRAFHGWQRHPGVPTVQGALEEALRGICDAPVEVRGAGRTDRGTHARGQVANARIPGGVSVETLRAGLRDALPAALTLRDIREVDRSFHARMSATGKRYVYTIWNRPELSDEDRGRVWHVPGALDVAAMQAVLPMFVGEHDFASFASKANHARNSTVRTVSRFELVTGGPHSEPTSPPSEAASQGLEPALVFTIEADGFLYKMVRNLVRAVVKVGEGRWSAAQLQDIFAAKDRQQAPGTAPASGLCLDEVFYAEPHA